MLHNRYDALKSQGLKEERLLLLESWRDAEAAALQQAAVGEGTRFILLFLSVCNYKPIDGRTFENVLFANFSSIFHGYIPISTQAKRRLVGST